MAFLFIYLFFTELKPSTLSQRSLISSHFLFVGYVFLVNLLWFFFIDQSQEKRFPTILHSFFYVFNFLALRSALILSNAFKDKFVTYTCYAVGAGLILQTVLSFLMGSTHSRNALFFNNPNQLGDYALLAGSLLIYCVRSVKINVVFQLAAYFSFFYLTLISASKAALAGSIILISIAVLNQGLLSFRQFFVLAAAIFVGGYFVFKSELGSELFSYSMNRFETIGTSGDDSYEGRGYDRILNNPEYLVFGAGEGGYYRFDTLLKAGEIHSSFGTIIFCYGIVGFILFVLFLYKIFKGAPFFELLYFVPVFAYSITHQGLRDSLFWVFLGVVFIINEQKQRAKRTRRVVVVRPLPHNHSVSGGLAVRRGQMVRR